MKFHQKWRRTHFNPEYPSKSESVEKWKGKRAMVDLRDMVLKYYYNPYTKGSNSIKAVLPAALQSSKYLRIKYAQPLKEIGLSSLNFSENHIWLQENGGVMVSPYKMLPPLFEGWNEEEMEETISELEGIADGGMALTAYAKLQYVDMSEREREELTLGLKKYCELDTLAMVMIYEHFRELVWVDLSIFWKKCWIGYHLVLSAAHQKTKGNK